MAEAPKRRLCEGKTKKGKLCRAEALPGRQFCVHHDPDLPDDDPRRMGRYERSRRAWADLWGEGDE